MSHTDIPGRHSRWDDDEERINEKMSEEKEENKVVELPSAKQEVPVRRILLEIKPDGNINIPLCEVASIFELRGVIRELMKFAGM